MIRTLSRIPHPRTRLGWPLNQTTLSIFVYAVKMGIWGVIVSAIVMLASTNIDVAIVLVVCFANASDGKDGLKSRHVWVGQFIGFSILVVISLVGVFVGSFLPPHYSGLLGLVPLCIGLWRTQEWCNKEGDDTDGDLESGGDYELHASGHVQMAMTSQNERKSRISLTSCTNASVIEEHLDAKPHSKTNSVDTSVVEASCSDGSDTWDLEEDSHSSSSVAAEESVSDSRTNEDDKPHSVRWSTFFSFHSLKMTAITLSNGGDNVAVYAAGLATYNAGEILLTLAIFYPLLVLWLYVTNAFVSIHLMSNFIRNYGSYIIPVALISLGVYIPWSTNVLSLVCSSR